MIRRLSLALAFALFGSTAWGATIYVTEITSAPPTVVFYQAAKAPFITVQHVQVGSNSVRTNPFNYKTGLIRVVSDTACHIVINSLPTATANDTYIPANVPEYFVVNAGDELAVITN